MMLIVMSLIFIMSLAMIVMLVATIINLKANKDREKSSPFECGFSPFNTARIPFSLRFFLIAVIFLIFDVEITLLLPAPILLTSGSPTIVFFTMTMFLVLLILGLYYEWKKGALDWTS
uniref:NADH-ubiquinone oxidoreductase chain 3 n=1 Tax=Lithobius maqinensis TaxID=2250572 RepID=Q9G402_9MYRI|nr:NADH dehydrogenase subunit 3 [Lithobius forficatus]AAG39991.1 NADH dehydrogenase subunit 3 [Lithobius forficatus]